MEDKFGKKGFDDGGDDKGLERSLDGPVKKKKEKKAAPAAPTGEPMIVVNVNDRLGTKASIPCLASDPIRMFLLLFLPTSSGVHIYKAWIGDLTD